MARLAPALLYVQADTVVRWQRERFRRFWARLSKPQRRGRGRPRTAAELRRLIEQMAAANPLWRAPRIHGELKMLGIVISERTVSRILRTLRRPPNQTWKTFLHNHVGQMVSTDFFTVPTVTMKVLFVFIVLEHLRRKLLHFNVTEHPTGAWTAQQVVEAFADREAARYLIRDRDSRYSAEVRLRIKSLGVEEILTAPRSPWQNPYAERLIGSIRRECLNLSFAKKRSGQKLLCGNTFIPMVEATQQGNGDNVSNIQHLSRKRTLLAQAQVRSRFMVVAKIRRQRSLQMAGVQNDVVIQAFPSDRADESLGVWILPGAARCCQNLLDAQRLDSQSNLSTVPTVPVAEEVRGSVTVCERLYNLLCGPISGRMLGHIKMQHFATIVFQDNEYEEDLHRDGRHGKEISGYHLADMVVQEGPPGLVRRAAERAQDARDSALREGDTEHLEFAVNPGCAPQGIGRDHL